MASSTSEGTNQIILGMRGMTRVTLPRTPCDGENTYFLQPCQVAHVDSTHHDFILEIALQSQKSRICDPITRSIGNVQRHFDSSQTSQITIVPHYAPLRLQRTTNNSTGLEIPLGTSTNCPKLYPSPILQVVLSNYWSFLK